MTVSLSLLREGLKLRPEPGLLVLVGFTIADS